MTNFPAIVNGLLGIFAGLCLLNKEKSQLSRLSVLMIAGGVCLLSGLIWSLYFPLNKNLWTSSFVLVTSGISFLLMGSLYWITDIKGYQKWTFPFRLIGCNSILIGYVPVKGC